MKVKYTNNHTVVLEKRSKWKPHIRAKI